MALEDNIEDALKLLKQDYDNFPVNCCKFGVKEMRRRGYKIVFGTVLLDNYCDMGKNFEQKHYWNFDKESDRFFDITSSQFNIHLSEGKKLPHIAIWKNNEIPIYIPKIVDISGYKVI